MSSTRRTSQDEPRTRDDPLDDAPLLRALRAKNVTDTPRRGGPARSRRRTPSRRRSSRRCSTSPCTCGYYEKEYLPFLTEKQLKLDFGLSFDRDRFYNTFQALQRKIASYREENRRLLEGMVGREMELEVRKRTPMLTRLIQAEAARFFRTIARFCAELIEDAHGDMVKCLNCNGVIHFDPIEGARVLQGRTVGGALGDLQDVRLRGGCIPEHARDRRPGDRACR